MDGRGTFDNRINDAEKASTMIPYTHLLLDHGIVDPRTAAHVFPGAGTAEDPYIVGWIDKDARNPLNFSDARKWLWTLLVAVATMAATLTTSAYTAPARELKAEFAISQVVFALGLSLFVLGFGLGPIFWSLLSEMYGRQIVFLGTVSEFVALNAFNAGCAAAPKIESLLIMRFFGRVFGSSPLTNAGGVVADIWPARQRGLALVAFSSAPLFGPVFGPIIGGFIGESYGWRWVQGFLAILSGTMSILVALIVPETYGPLLLERRSQSLTQLTGHVHVSKLNKGKPEPSLRTRLQIALSRPWLMLFHEPIVLILTVYLALLYGTIYIFFGAFPIVYQPHRGWSEGIGGLSFCDIALGVLLGILYMFPENARYHKIADRHEETPETRLPPSIVGSIAIPVSIFWFAWTNDLSVHWIVSIAAQVPFGFGFVLVYISVQEYLVDAYTVYAASGLAANTIFRSAFGAGFPLFTNVMYTSLGDHWASSIPAFLSLCCIPFPILFYRHGSRIRAECRYAAEAAQHLENLQEKV
ncbi:MAG: hypothetical protein Q9185_005399 [Variospora sp. 1 TL-2023]